VLLYQNNKENEAFFIIKKMKLSSESSSSCYPITETTDFPSSAAFPVNRKEPRDSLLSA